MATHPYDIPRFQLLDRLSRRLLGCATADATTRAAVAVLTADADPHRAQRLVPGEHEPAVLVERLAAWALHRAGDDAVAGARAVLDAELDRLREPVAGTVRQR